MNEYVTTDEFKTYLGISDAIDDAWWPTAIEAASRGVDEFCYRHFYAAPSVASQAYRPSTVAVVGTGDIYTTSELVVETDDGDTGSYSTTWTIDTDFILEPVNGIVNGITGHPYTRLRAVGGRSFPISSYGRYGVRVTAKFGWSAVPATVKMATLELAKDLGKSKDFSAGAIGFGDVVARIRENPMLVARLAPFRHPDAIRPF